MIAASTGAPLRPSASPAARPSITIKTFSCTPAPTESTASSAVPRGASSSPTGWTSSSFAPVNALCFCVATTVPITRASCNSVSSPPSSVFGPVRAGPADPPSTLHVPMIDDSHDACVRGNLSRMKREARFLPSDEEHCLADASADCIHGDQRATGGVAVRIEGLEHQQLDSAQVLVLDGCHDIADDPGDLHGVY